jgi:hypothetical protein
MGITKNAYPIFRYTDIVDHTAIGNLHTAYLGYTWIYVKIVGDFAFKIIQVDQEQMGMGQYLYRYITIVG